MNRGFLVAIAVLLSCILSAAQPESSRFQVFGGYSLVTGDFTGINPERGNNLLLNGWNASFNFSNTAHPAAWGIVADFSGYYPSYTYSGASPFTVTSRSHSFLFGPQVSVPTGKVEPFVHFLLGMTHVSYPAPSGCSLCANPSANSLAYAVGGGADVYFRRHVGVRGQIDLFGNGFSSSDNQLTYRYHEVNARISSGLVFRF